MKVRHVIAALTVAGAGLTGVLLSPVTAQADSSDCPYTYICMWEDPNYKGSMYVRQPDDLGSYDIDGWDGDNEISSVFNSSNDFCVRLYDNDNWTGTSYTVGINQMIPRLGSFDNEAESYKIIRC